MRLNFLRKNCFDRHNQEQHYETSVNLDFVEDMDDIEVIQCEDGDCNKTFNITHAATLFECS